VFSYSIHRGRADSPPARPIVDCACDIRLRGPLFLSPPLGGCATTPPFKSHGNFFFFPEVFSVPSGAKLLPHFEYSSRASDGFRSMRCFLLFCAQTRRRGLLLTKPACDRTLEKGSHPHPCPPLPNRGIVCPRPMVANNYDTLHISTPIYKSQCFLRHSVLSG